MSWKWYHYLLLGGLGAGVGYLFLEKKVGCPLAAIAGAAFPVGAMLLTRPNGLLQV